MCVALAGCTSGRDAKPTESPPSEKASTANAPPDTPEGGEHPGARPEPPADGQEHLSRVIAEVNGRPLYEAFYEQGLSYIRDRLPPGQDASTLQRYLSAKFEALDRMVDDELIYQAAQKERLAATESEAEGEFKRLATAAGGEGRLVGKMKAQGISRYDGMEGIRRRISVDRYVRERLTNGLAASDDEALEYYNSHLTRFIPEVWVKVHVITVDCPQSATAARVDRARRRAEEILRIVRSGRPFESVAREYSEDTFSTLGGSIGLVKKGATYPEWDAVIFSMKPGEVSEPVRTKDGFHLLHVKERRGGEPRPFETVKEECRKAVLTRKQSQALDQEVKRLRANATIVSYLD